MIRPIQAVVDWYNRESFVRYAIRSGFRDETVRGDIRMVEGQPTDGFPGQLRKLDDNRSIHYCMALQRESNDVIVTALGIDGLRSYSWKTQPKEGTIWI